jgi:hypothetical protein
MSVKKKKQLLATSCWLLALGSWSVARIVFGDEIALA